jgi:hypothetical protein
MSLAELSLMSPVDTSFLGKSLASPSSASSQNAAEPAAATAQSIALFDDDAHGGKIHIQDFALGARPAATCGWDCSTLSGTSTRYAGSH